MYHLDHCEHYPVGGSSRGVTCATHHPAVRSEIAVYQDKGTGRDTLRDDYQALMCRVLAGEVERVIVLEQLRDCSSVGMSELIAVKENRYSNRLNDDVFAVDVDPWTHRCPPSSCVRVTPAAAPA
ncbi:hypothetical protein [Halalkalicoccus salilacus]|uniref:hypothetical protein n=1 Tax=Halalkalicoccus salilacus TaxID=3117459 RepID=UPI00300EBA6D